MKASKVRLSAAIKVRLSSVSRIFAEHRVGLCSIFGFAIGFVPLPVTCASEEGFRYSGFLFQFLGLLAVAKGIGDTRNLYGQPGLMAQIGEFVMRLGRAITRGPKTVSGSATIALEGTAFGIASAGAVLTKAPSTLEETLDALQAEVDKVRQDLAALRAKTEEALAQVHDSINREQQDRATAVDEIGKLLKEKFVGGLGLETAGLLWLLVGTAIGSFSQELSRLALLPCWR